MKLGVPTAEVLPPSYESRKGDDLLKQTYDVREANPIQIIVETHGTVWERAAIRDIQAYSDKIRHTSGVNQVRSFITVLGNHPPAQTAALLGPNRMKQRFEEQKLAKGHAALLVVVPRSDPESAETASLIRQLRQIDSGPLHALVTGRAAYRVDMLERINRGFPAMIGFVMLVTYAVLLSAFRSVLLPMKLC
ncbi:MMPL family transporter [Aneurinibacillus tyrosinisolvens]|uniref:MMPL family transporter n=1 Tax=Aneurinibacillus tyrosinisolvens TaxID=1443435 RepID=UPI0022A94E2E|nr:MMPL family transporter [Aneurinibacillus tyrosinisolvens]